MLSWIDIVEPPIPNHLKLSMKDVRVWYHDLGFWEKNILNSWFGSWLLKCLPHLFQSWEYSSLRKWTPSLCLLIRDPILTCIYPWRSSTGGGLQDLKQKYITLFHQTQMDSLLFERIMYPILPSCTRLLSHHLWEVFGSAKNFINL